jgi:benzoylformate decarboxylase
LIELLKTEGVEYVFGLPGSTELGFLDVLQDHPEIKYVLGLHESIAVGMAEGYARASGKVGVINVHSVAGLAAAMPGLLNLFGSKAPSVIIAGQQDSRILLTEPAKSADLKEIARQFAKWSAEVARVEDIPLALHRAFKLAREAPQGTAFVSVPQDILEQEFDYERPAQHGFFPQTRPDVRAVEVAAGILAAARRPLMVVGAGVARNEAVKEAVELAELIGAPVYQTWVGDVNFPADHELYMGELRIAGREIRKLLDRFDVVVSVGNPVFKPNDYCPDGIVSPHTMIVHVDDDPWEINKNEPTEAGLLGHIGLSLKELNASLESRLSQDARRMIADRRSGITQESRAIREGYAHKAGLERNRVPIVASRVTSELSSFAEAGAVIVDDAWSSSAAARENIEFTRPGSYYRLLEYKHAGGGLGWGMPFALGVQLAEPGRRVVALLGDGTAMFSCQSLWTAAHYELPVVFVVLANGSYHALKSAKARSMGKDATGRFLGLDITPPRVDFAGLAASMGIGGQRVDRPESILPAFTAAFETKQPTLIEIAIDDAV